jgi:hypothetical protein
MVLVVLTLTDDSLITFDDVLGDDSFPILIGSFVFVVFVVAMITFLIVK